MVANNSGRYVGLHGTVMARMAAAILSYDDRDEDHDEKDSIFRWMLLRYPLHFGVISGTRWMDLQVG